MALSDDGKTLVSGSHDGTVKVWNLAMGQGAGPPFKGHENRVHAVALSSDGKTVVSASGDATVKIWDLSFRVWNALLFKGHAGPIPCVALSGDGKTIASGGADHSIKLWDMGTGQERATLKGHTAGVWSVALSRRRQDPFLRKSGHDHQGLGRGHGSGTRHPQGTVRNLVASLALSGDGKTLFSGSTDGTVKIWDVNTGQERTTLKGHSEGVVSVASSAMTAKPSLRGVVTTQVKYLGPEYGSGCAYPLWA